MNLRSRLSCNIRAQCFRRKNRNSCPPRRSYDKLPVRSSFQWIWRFWTSQISYLLANPHLRLVCPKYSICKKWAHIRLNDCHYKWRDCDVWFYYWTWKCISAGWAEYFWRMANTQRQCFHKNSQRKGEEYHWVHFGFRVHSIIFANTQRTIQVLVEHSWKNISYSYWLYKWLNLLVQMWTPA